jgi:methanogenic corrinoid protein MtbC1
MSANPLTHADHSVRQLRGSDDTRRDCLARVIESEIIPRLLVAHRTKTQPISDSIVLQPGVDDIHEFVDLLLADDSDAAKAFADGWHARGLSLETLYLGLFTDSARYLGAMWTEDTCSFTEVTLAMWRLQRLMHDYSAAFQSEGPVESPAGLRVLLAPVAAEQHTFGMLMVAEFFRRAGWEVCGELPAANVQLVDLVRTEWIDIIGLSVSGDVTFGELAGVIASLRHASRNINVGIMVGGSVFLEKPELALAVGADFSASTPPEAVSCSRQHVEGATGTGRGAHLK